MQQAVWHPSEKYVHSTNLFQFMQKHGLPDFETLIERSAADVAWFWAEVVRDLGVEWLEPYERVVDTSRGAAWARWFVGGKLNVAYECVDKWAARNSHRDKLAVVWESEDGHSRQLTYSQLFREVNRAAGVLRRLGVGRGDRVGIYMPMIPEVAIAALACAKIGAIFTPIFSGLACRRL